MYHVSFAISVNGNSGYGSITWMSKITPQAIDEIKAGVAENVGCKPENVAILAFSKFDEE